MSFFDELRRRKVVRTAVAYAALAWLLASVAEYGTETFEAPVWVLQAFTIVLIIGFPVALVLSWIFKWTPQRITFEDRLGPVAPSVSAIPPDAVDDTQIRSIAVLPLDDFSENPTSAFADGMTEALIADLAKHSDLSVISRTSVMQYRGTSKPLREIAEELGVDAVVEGSVVRAGDDVRITAQLIRARSDDHIWADTYNYELKDVLKLQDDVARAISGEIDTILGRTARREAADVAEVSPDAYLHYLKGREHLHKRTEQGFLAAKEQFTRALEIDPLYALAHAGLADSYCMLANYGLQPAREVAPRARAAVARALEIDGNSVDARRVKALTLWQFDFDWAAADREYERAMELDPNDSMVKYWFGICLGARGETERAYELMDQAKALDPLALIIPTMQGWLQAVARDYDKAGELLRNVLSLEPEYFVGNMYLGEVLVAQGLLDKGIPYLEKAAEVSDRSPRASALLGWALGLAGKEAQAREQMDYLQALAAERYISRYFMAVLSCGLKDLEATLEHLEQAIDMADPMLRDLYVAPQWDWLRGEGRFQEMVSRLNLTAGT